MAGTGILFLICVNERSPDSPLPCCAARGSRDLLAAFQAEYARRGYPRGVKIVGTTCLTTCQCGPTVAVYPEAIWYGGVTAEDIPELLDAHIAGRGPVERLRVPANVSIW